MAAFYAVTLIKASSYNDFQPTRVAPRKTLESDLSDDGDIVVSFLSWEHHFRSSTR
jgi:hypothetical protein